MTTRSIGMKALVTSLGFTAISCGSGQSDGDYESQLAVVAPTKGYADPTTWVARRNEGTGVDPLNVILSGNSDVRSPTELLKTFATDWLAVGTSVDVAGTACMPPLLADVDGAAKAQSSSWRPGGCSKVAAELELASAPKVGGVDYNRVRAWPQATGAWFMAVSEQHLCATVECVDDAADGRIGGFNQGREDLKGQLVLSASQHHVQVVDGQGSACPSPTTGVGCLAWHYDSSPAVSSEAGAHGVSSDGRVLVLTVKKGPDWLAEFPNGPAATLPASAAPTNALPTSSSTPTAGTLTNPALPSKPIASGTAPASATPAKPTGTKPSATPPKPSHTNATTPSASSTTTPTNGPPSIDQTSSNTPCSADSTPLARDGSAGDAVEPDTRNETVIDGVTTNDGCTHDDDSRDDGSQDDDSQDDGAQDDDSQDDGSQDDDSQDDGAQDDDSQDQTFVKTGARRGALKTFGSTDSQTPATDSVARAPLAITASSSPRRRARVA